MGRLVLLRSQGRASQDGVLYSAPSNLTLQDGVVYSAPFIFPCRIEHPILRSSPLRAKQDKATSTRLCASFGPVPAGKMPGNGGKKKCLREIIPFNINPLSLFRMDKHDFYPPPPNLAHTACAALMGPDDHRHSGGRAAYGSRGQRCPWRAESLSHVPPGLRVFRKERPMRQPGQKAVTGRVASPHIHTG